MFKTKKRGIVLEPMISRSEYESEDSYDMNKPLIAHNELIHRQRSGGSSNSWLPNFLKGGSNLNVEIYETEEETKQTKLPPRLSRSTAKWAHQGSSQMNTEKKKLEKNKLEKKNKLEGKKNKLDGKIEEKNKLEGKKNKLEGNKNKLEGKKNKLEGKKNKLEGKTKKAETKPKVLKKTHKRIKKKQPHKAPIPPIPPIIIRSSSKRRVPPPIIIIQDSPGSNKMNVYRRGYPVRRYG